MTNVLIVSRFGSKKRLNALNVKSKCENENYTGLMWSWLRPGQAVIVCFCRANATGNDCVNVLFPSRVFVT